MTSRQSAYALQHALESDPSVTVVVEAHLRSLVGEVAAAEVLRTRPLSSSDEGHPVLHERDCPQATTAAGDTDLLEAHRVRTGRRSGQPQAHSCLGAGAVLSEVWEEEWHTLSILRSLTACLQVHARGVRTGLEVEPELVLSAITRARGVSALTPLVEECERAMSSVLRCLSPTSIAALASSAPHVRTDAWASLARGELCHTGRAARSGALSVLSVSAQLAQSHTLRWWEESTRVGAQRTLLALPRGEAAALARALQVGGQAVSLVETPDTWLDTPGALELCHSLHDELVIEVHRSGHPGAEVVGHALALAVETARAATSA